MNVLILFFNRPDRLAQVFAQVKLARPERLFLYQDGPRGEHDHAKIAACREIVADSQIDWPCEVHRNYQSVNYGCDPSGFMAQTWAFSHVDRCIVLEDDIVADQRFFTFCDELLERYADDSRVWMVAGFNAEGRWEKSLSVEENSASESVDSLAGTGAFATNVFSIWGWASWRRVIATWDEHYTWMDNPAKLAKVERVVKEQGLRKDFLPMCWRHRASGRAHFETIFWSSMILNDAVALMSTRNLISNIGISSDSTHFQGSLKTMPRRLRRQFVSPESLCLGSAAGQEAEQVSGQVVGSGSRVSSNTVCVSEPLVIDEAFKRAVYLRNAWNNPCRKVQYSLEELVLNLRYGNLRAICKAINLRARKLLGRA